MPARAGGVDYSGLSSGPSGHSGHHSRRDSGAVDDEARKEDDCEDYQAQPQEVNQRTQAERQCDDDCRDQKKSHASLVPAHVSTHSRRAEREEARAALARPDG